MNDKYTKSLDLIDEHLSTTTNEEFLANYNRVSEGAKSGEISCFVASSDSGRSTAIDRQTKINVAYRLAEKIENDVHELVEQIKAINEKS